MNQDKNYPGRFPWLHEKGTFLLILGPVLLLIGVSVFSWYLDYRIDQVEDKMQYVPPRSYQPPNLENYTAGDIDVDKLRVRQLVYVPVYSHVYYQGGAPYSLETTLSIRNINPDQVIYLTTVQYFDTNGKLVKTHLDQMIKLSPLQTIEFLVERRDSTGGSGANFIVQWLSERETDKPLVEAVMVGTSGTQGICFSRMGIEISSTSDGDQTE
ncbi:hypothetical protein CA13_29330 [Planctomycetes bacterium CA13]|uniref:DUF3124 domain-containing protein n=1 Tax=Novipirellula herctigrandis TaxID=2527986 RepID=A0A5C5Z2R7_9BACT|nr:hypothetical protein CA13_29330 [Planctomycetes bacterium CA13]